MQTYRAAVIGCGRMGAGVERYSAKLQPWAHASIFSQHAQTELVALVDVDASKQEKLAKDFPGVPFFTDVKTMMEQTTPDLVSIVTLPQTHAELVELVSSYPVRAILCEKPIASNLVDAQRMVTRCHERGVILLINHLRRFDPQIRAAKQSCDAKGKLMQGHASYTRGIHNNGTHVIDMLRFFMGEIVSVIGVRNMATETFTDLPGDWNIDGLLFFESGASAAIQTVDSNAYSIFDFDFYAERGRVSLKHFGFRIEDAGLKPCSGFIGHNEVDDLHADIHGDVRSFMQPAVGHLIDCIEGKDQPVSTGEDGIAALRVIDALMESAAKHGAMVRL